VVTRNIIRFSRLFLQKHFDLLVCDTAQRYGRIPIFGTNVPLQISAHVQPWIRRQYIPPKHHYQPARLHGTRTHKTVVLTTYVRLHRISAGLERNVGKHVGGGHGGVGSWHFFPGHPYRCLYTLGMWLLTPMKKKKLVSKLHDSENKVLRIASAPRKDKVSYSFGIERNKKLSHYYRLFLWLPTTVVTQSKAWNAFAPSNNRIVGLIPTWSMDACPSAFSALYWQRHWDRADHQSKAS
jgi:hypothetical protein